jgi:hypothetical protein
MKMDDEISGELSNPFAEENGPEVVAQEEESNPQSSDKREGREGKSKGSPQFTKFLEELDQKNASDEKIHHAIAFMREALTHQGAPRFRDFWEARKLCLPLFKESLQPKVRSQLWEEYIELSGEARRLKEILDEQSAFAVEQIELAIQAIERDIEHSDVLLSHAEKLTFPHPSTSLKGKEELYTRFQQELQLLNTLAARINGLRKEIIKTEMRIKAKNKLFERLSHCGDRVFPRRKELIKSVSDEFSQDVEQFVTSHFNGPEQHNFPLYALREEIKALQSIAKLLTLNTQCFTQTRLRLSECWDKLKEKDKERKKEIATKKLAFKQNYDAVMEKIQPFAEACQGEISLEEANRQAAEIGTFMRGLELGREEVKLLKEELARAKNPVLDRSREQEMQRQQKEQEIEVARRDKINALKGEIEQLLSAPLEGSFEEAMAKRDALWARYEELSLNKAEKMLFERQFKQLKDAINECRGKALMNLSDDALKSLEQFDAILNEYKERRSEIKTQLESYRKALGGSGFDFEKAMMYRELIEAEKGSLDKVNAAIDELEEKIAEIEG